MKLSKQGFFVVTQRKTNDSIAIKFNAEKILRTDEPIIIEP
jgi:hypothetical protein